MGPISKTFSRAAGSFTILLAVLCTALFAVSAQDLSAEQVIEKHLAAVGTPQARAAAENHLAAGVSGFASKLPARKTEGKVVIVSQGNDLMLLVSLASKEYPFEKIGYFNGKTSLPYVSAGDRSPLGAFVNDHPSMLSDSLLTGAISKTWVFYKGGDLKGRIKSSGTKKIDGRKVYAIDFFPLSNASTEYTVKLFFDAETFDHVRTEYRHVIAPDMDKFGQLGRQAGTKLSVVEDFGNFKTTEGLRLPHLYNIHYQTDSNRGVYEWDWVFNIANYYFHQKLEPGFFSFDTEK